MGDVQVIESFQGQDITWRSQVLKEDKTLLVQGDIASITARIFLLPTTTAEQVVPLIIQETVYDAAQTEGWEGADPGYNFKWVADGLYFPKGSVRYRVEIKFSVYSASGVTLDTPVFDVFEVVTTEVLSP